MTVRDEGLARNKAIYVALGISVEGEKKVLGLWVEQTEGAKPALGLDPRVLAQGFE